MLMTFPAGRTKPYLIPFYPGQSERSLPDDPAHTERSHPIPRANGIAESALKAPFEGFSTVRSNEIDDLFVIGYILHSLS
jgi:hypothetical protein